MILHTKQKLEKKNHAGLKKLKIEFMEMIAVEARVGTVKAPILCFMALRCWKNLTC